MHRFLSVTLTVGLCISASTGAQVYPSTATAWVLTGYWEPPTGTPEFHSIQDVQRWEARHADAVFGSLSDAELNKKTIAMGYMYAQKLDCKPDEQQGWLRKQAYQQGQDPEDGYLHYQNDTQLTLPVYSKGLDYLLNGESVLSVVNRNNVVATARYPLNVNSSEEIFFHAGYPFENIVVTSDAHPDIFITVSDEDGNIARFEKADVLWIQRENKWYGRINARWQATTPMYQGLSLNTGNKALEAGYRSWTVALRWSHNSNIQDVKIDPWLHAVKSKSAGKAATMLFPGWDPKNDPNGDGYVDDDEFLSRSNLSASARFKHQSRVIPTGNMWPGSCWYRTNLNNKTFNQHHANWFKYDWQRQGLAGAYNDDMAKLFRSDQFDVLFGGKILEVPIMAGTVKAANVYADQLADFFELVKQTTGSKWLAANISELNLWEYSGWPKALRNVVDVWLREHYLSPSIGLTRLQSYWDNYALAALGDKSLIMTTTRGGKSQQAPLNKAAWESDIYTGLALYYLFNIPETTYYHSWNQSYIYGSGNTFADPNNLANTIWYQSGVPKNWAYQPQKVLAVDIGQPTVMPSEAEAVSWHSKTGEAITNETTIEGIALEPAHWFWLYRKGWLKRDIPKDGVVARQYTQGLVLYRGAKYRNQMAFYDIEPIQVTLPGTYQRVHYDGTLGDPIKTITVKGYEGIILKKAPEA